MASLYDAVRASNSTYVPQFVGSTFNELSEAGKALDTRWRQNKDYSDKIAMMLENEQYLENDRAIKDQLRENIYGQINDIASSEANFENSSAAVSQAARDFFTNQNRIAAQDNFRLAEKAREMENQGFNLNFGDDYRKFSTVGEDGKPRRFNLDMQKQMDYSKKMQELLGRVAADGGFTDPRGERVNLTDTERWLIKSGNWQGIGQKKLNDLVEGLIPAYKESEEGRQQLRKLTQLDGFTGDVMQVKDAAGVRQTTDIDEKIRQDFRAIAAPQKFYQAAQRWDDFGETARSAAARAAQAYTEAFSGSSPGPVTRNSALQAVPYAEQGDEYSTLITEGPNAGKLLRLRNAKGEYVKKADQSVYGAGAMAAESGKPLDGLEAVYVDPKEVEGEMRSMFEKQQEFERTVAGRSPSFKTFDEFKQAYKQAHQNHAQITPQGKALGKEARTIYNDYVQAAKARSPLIDPETGETTSLRALADKLGVNPADINLTADQVYYTSPNRDLPGGVVNVQVEVKGTDKKYPLNLYMPTNDQFVALASDIDHLFKNSYYAGRDLYTDENPYVPQNFIRDSAGRTKGFYTRTILDKSAKGEGRFKTVVHEVDVVPNQYGGFDVAKNFDKDSRGVPRERTYTMAQWEEMMASAYAPRFKNALLSGQTLSGEDIKKTPTTR